jgi:thioredoxin-like negative regulator of GroEL
MSSLEQAFEEDTQSQPAQPARPPKQARPRKPVVRTAPRVAAATPAPASLRGTQPEEQAALAVAPVAARSADPARANALRATALEQMNQGAIDDAVANLKRAVELDPSSAAIKRDLARALRIQSTVQARR